MTWRTARIPLTAALLLAVALVPVAAQAAPGTAVKDLFTAYEYYEDNAQTRAGVATLVTLAADELDFVAKKARSQGAAGFAMLARKDDEHWMGLQRTAAGQLLRIRDGSNDYNARITVDTVRGRLTVLRGVDYKPFNRAEDAAVTAFLAAGYLRRAMAEGDVFPAILRMPAVDPAALGTASSSSASPSASSSTSASAAQGSPAAAADWRTYLRLWSTAEVAARELFAADGFGSDSILEAGDFAQAVLSYTDADGSHELTGKDLEVLIVGRVRLPEDPFRVEDLVTFLSSLASRVGGVDLAIIPLRTIFYVPSTPPAAIAGAAPSGSRDPVLSVFDHLQALGLLAGDYSVVPEASVTAPGLTQQDLDVYWWARLQRAAVPAALYPPLIDSGGKLSWGDFALFASAGLARARVPSMILVVRRPGKAPVPYHAICVFQVGKSWRWFDAGRFGDETADDWQLLPARIYGKDVVFRVVDVAREWLSSTLDESSGWLMSRAAR
jgi:hypothetical protein